MTAQDPRTVRVVPSVPGGTGKTVAEAEVPWGTADGPKHVPAPDRDVLASAECWTPVLIDTPFTTSNFSDLDSH